MTRAVTRLARAVERRWDGARLARAQGRPPEHLRIVPYLGHGTDRVLVRGRVLDGPEPTPDAQGESAWAAARRTVRRFLTDELPGVPLRVRIGDADVETLTDAEGYFSLEVMAGLGEADAPWAEGEVSLASPYRGLGAAGPARLRVRVRGAGAGFGVISDVDDTLLQTGAQRAWEMARVTLTGSALTRLPFAGAPELYRALAGSGRAAHGRPDVPPGVNPVFYVSSSPWNLHDFLVAFLEHRGFPLGPLLLRDLLGDRGDRSHAAHKLDRIAEVLRLEPGLSFVLVGDSGQHDPEIYAEAVRRHPGRILAVYVREVRLDPGDRRVEEVTDAWDSEVPFVLAADSAAIARHAAGLGLVGTADVDVVAAAVAATGPSSRSGGASTGTVAGATPESSGR